MFLLYIGKFWGNLFVISIVAVLSYILIEKPAIDARAVFKNKNVLK